jgi:hypothetical protein
LAIRRSFAALRAADRQTAALWPLAFRVCVMREAYFQ